MTFLHWIVMNVLVNNAFQHGKLAQDISSSEIQ